MPSINMIDKWLTPIVIVILSLVLSACNTKPLPPIVNLSVQPQVTKPPFQSVLPMPSIASPAITPNSEIHFSSVLDPQTSTLDSQATTSQPALKLLVATPESSLPAANQPVVQQLLSAADKLKASGQREAAIMQLRRAQRIAPREPKVYARLAALHLSAGQDAQAEQLSRKGLTLTAGQVRYQYFFWRIIAASRRYQGDDQGVAWALQQAQRYQ